MDDKEKEKFGVVIEKEKQPGDDQSKVEEKSLESENLTPKTENQDVSETKQPENENIADETSQETVIEENNENKTDESNQEIKNQENETVIQESNENKNEEEKKEHEVIHKKDGRLHIYVRQDKYKGELKSKNWVGRLYIDGKQKISSSGTPNLEEAIPILEKWFDDVQNQKQKELKNLEEQAKTEEAKPSEAPIQSEVQQTQEIKKQTDQSTTLPQENINAETQEEEKPKNIFEKLKNIKFKAPSFGKKDSNALKFKPKGGNVKEKFNNFINARLGKKTVQGEEIVGVEITNKEIRLSQISSNKGNQWVLDRFYVHPIDLPDDAAIIEHATKVSEELNIALQKSKITTPNAAIAIPVTLAPSSTKASVSIPPPQPTSSTLAF